MAADGGKARFIYSPDYYCDIGDHVFRTEKYGLLHKRLVSAGLVGEKEFLRPEPAERADLELVHTPAYVSDLMAGEHTSRTMRSEMPISPGIVQAFVLGAGGTMLACRTALSEGTFAMNLAGGFHHAFPDWAEGFCYINDVAVGVARVREDGMVRRVMVVDCDLHQGNGTAYIFRDEPDVFTFSIHQESNYPVKRRSDLDIGLPDFCSGRRYLQELGSRLPAAMDQHEPEMVLYVAGADPYEEDILGGLRLTMDHLQERDRLVLGACVERNLPAAVVLAGGYAIQVQDTVTVHYNTAAAMCELAPALRQANDE
ncbi:MAG: histone deacetylase [Candidatus Brocadiia bacterium]